MVHILPPASPISASVCTLSNSHIFEFYLNILLSLMISQYSLNTSCVHLISTVHYKRYICVSVLYIYFPLQLFMVLTMGQVCPKHFSFSCQFSFHQMIHTHLSSGAGTVGQLVDSATRGFSLSPFHEIKKKYIFMY
jgi:hypothetical protein